MTEYKCIGCGAVLQSEDENESGFVPKSRIHEEDVICRRCFRLKNYNETPDVNIESGEFMTMLNSIYEKDGVIVKVIDVFDFEGSIIPSFNRIVGNKKIIVAVNKIDLLPKSTNVSRLLNRLKKMLADEGIIANETVVVSGAKGFGLDDLLEQINQYSTGKDVYVVGTTNVGKSTLINKLIEATTGEKEVFTTSNIPGTTLGMIDIPLGNNQFMYDTPGVIAKSAMSSVLTLDDVKHIMPKKEIKPLTYQLDEGQTLFISNLAQIDFVTGNRSSFTIYRSDKLVVHRTKLDNATEFYRKHYSGLLTPPELESPILLDNSETYTFKTDVRSDILISGLCFITVDKDITVNVTVPKGVKVIARQTVFKDK